MQLHFILYKLSAMVPIHLLLSETLEPLSFQALYLYTSNFE